ncbi:MAG: histidine kinase, partial [Candidatus Aminicenantes bacterium]|nr:histidine kinase [Candidatus Aminicenantes bacterium]
MKGIIKNLLTSRLAIHFYWWIFIYLFFFHLVGARESESFRWGIFFYFFFLPLPVDIHFFLLHHFFKRKKYLIYGLLLTSVIILMGFLTNLFNIRYLRAHDTLLKSLLEVSLIIIIVTAIKIVKDGFKQKLQLQEIQARQLQTELQLLGSQVNPHFLFNTLNNLYSLSLDNSDKLPRVIKKLSDLMAYMFESSQDQQVPVMAEKEFVENYLDLEKLRLPTGSDIRFIVEGNLDNRIIAPMLFIPLVENCFKHGAKATTGKFFVHLHLEVSNHKLIFTTSNNIGPRAQPSNSGMGLKNLRRRLELLYPGIHNLSVNQKKESFQAQLEIRW